MTGPVFFLELLHASRRGRIHWARWAYGGWLALELALFCYLYAFETLLFTLSGEQTSPDRAKIVSLIETFLFVIVFQHFVVMVIGSAVLAAGSLTDEKATGTLQDLLATNLSTWQIIVGKWLAHIIQMLILSLAVVPPLCLLNYLAGWGPGPAVIVLVSTLLPATAVAAMGVLVSVWSRKTPTAVFGTLSAGALIAMVLWVAGFAGYANPLSALQSAWQGQPFLQTGGRIVAIGLICLPITACCLTLAVWRLRPAFRRQLESGSSRTWSRFRWLQRPPVSDLPIRWKERYFGEMASLPGLSIVSRRFRIMGIVILTVASSLTILSAYLPPQVGLIELARACTRFDFQTVAAALARTGSVSYGFLFQSVAALIVVSLVVGIRAATSVTAERERRTWEGLLLTPLEAKQLIRGKAWGIVDSVRPYLLAYTIPALAFSTLGGIAALYWVVYWWLLTWAAMYFMAGAGVEASVRSSSSWRSLLTTLVTAGRNVMSRFVLLGAGCGWFIAIIARALLLVTTGNFKFFALSSVWTGIVILSVACVVPAIALFVQGEYLLSRAEALVAFYERVANGMPQILMKEKPKRSLFTRLLADRSK